MGNVRALGALVGSALAGAIATPSSPSTMAAVATHRFMSGLLTGRRRTRLLAVTVGLRSPPPDRSRALDSAPTRESCPSVVLPSRFRAGRRSTARCGGWEVAHAWRATER